MFTYATIYIIFYIVKIVLKEIQSVEFILSYSSQNVYSIPLGKCFRCNLSMVACIIIIIFLFRLNFMKKAKNNFISTVHTLGGRKFTIIAFLRNCPLCELLY